MDPMSIAAAAAGPIVGEVMGLFGGNKDEKQVEQQRKLTDIQLAADKNMFDYSLRKTNAGAQAQQLKAAGMNPALAMSGGASAGQGGTTSKGGEASSSTQREAMGLQRQMMGAQMAEMLSQAKKNEAEAKKIETADTSKVNKEIEGIGATIDKIGEEIKNFGVQRRLMEIESNLKGAATEKAMQEIVNLKTTNKITEGQAQSLIESAVQDVLMKKVEIRMKEKGIDVMDAEMKNMINQIAVEWGRIGVAKDKNDIDQIFNNWKAQHPGTSEQVGGMLEELKLAAREWIKGY